MNILLTNDDGITAQGIIQLAQALAKNHNVYVASPKSEQSGTSHSITYFDTISCDKVEYPNDIIAYAIGGTPVDCVKLALEVLFVDKDIDIVLSGINNLPNLGTDVFYSGTVNAAIEATITGYKGIALSTMCFDDDYAFPVEFTLNNLEKLARYASSSATINVNIPSKKEICKGVALGGLGIRRYDASYRVVSKPNEPLLYALDGAPILEMDSNLSHDVALFDRGYVAITPLSLFTTDQAVLKDMSQEDFVF